MCIIHRRILSPHMALEVVVFPFKLYTTGSASVLTSFMS